MITIIPAINYTYPQNKQENNISISINPNIYSTKSLLETISKKSGVKYSCENLLLNKKLFICFENQTLGNIDSAICKLLGAKITEFKTSIGMQKKIELLTEVRYWLRYRDDSYSKSFQTATIAARDYYSNRIKKEISDINGTSEEALSVPVNIKNASLFFSSLGNNFINDTCDYINSGYRLGIHKYNERGNFPLLIKYKDLTGEPKSNFDTWFSNFKIQKNINIIKDATDLEIRIGSRGGIGTSMIIFDNESKIQLSQQITSFGAMSPIKFQMIFENDFLKLCGKRPTPKSAFLDFTINDKLTTDQRVNIKNLKIENLKIASETHFRKQDIIKSLKLAGINNIIIDFHTSSARINIPETTILNFLDIIAKQFDILISSHNDFILIKDINHPELDKKEVPYPFMEKWLAIKEKKMSDAHSDFLFYSDFLELTKLSEERIYNLSLYEDKLLNVSFPELENLLSYDRWPGCTPFLFLKWISTIGEKNFRGDGMSISSLPEEMKQSLLTWAKYKKINLDDLSNVFMFIETSPFGNAHKETIYLKNKEEKLLIFQISVQ